MPVDGRLADRRILCFPPHPPGSARHKHLAQQPPAPGARIRVHPQTVLCGCAGDAFLHRFAPGRLGWGGDVGEGEVGSYQDDAVFAALSAYEHPRCLVPERALAVVASAVGEALQQGAGALSDGLEDLLQQSGPARVAEISTRQVDLYAVSGVADPVGHGFDGRQCFAAAIEGLGTVRSGLRGLPAWARPDGAQGCGLRDGDGGAGDRAAAVAG